MESDKMKITFKNMKDAGVGAWIVVVLIAIGFFLLVPIVSFWSFYFMGWVCSLVIGDVLVDALNMLFNTTYFTKEMIPVCAGALGWIGGFFRTVRNQTKNKD